MKMASQSKSESERPAGIHVPFKLHPRVFAALGADLVTSDVVAVIEQVKNSYDAFARRVDVRFTQDETGRPVLEVEDNGHGMDDKTIDEVWCTVATPFRLTAKHSRRGDALRRVTGAKGLGRLSVARLGTRLELVTKTAGGQCWKVDVSWDDLANAQDINVCSARRAAHPPEDLSHESGTRLRIFLKSSWTPERVEELREGLSRLVSPFSKLLDFTIYLTAPGSLAVPMEVKTSEFLDKPVYRLTGEFGADGKLSYKYVFRPYHGRGRSRQRNSYSWREIRTDLERYYDFKVADELRPTCGPFDFEVRAWDFEKESIEEAEQLFSISRSDLRSQIRSFKGLSLYRDGVLVLPKSETNRDWLGLDLRRVSLVGRRLSTSQIVGYVAISAEVNTKIEDTSDRERLVDTPEAKEFRHVLLYTVSVLEAERAQDKVTEEKPMHDMFRELSPEPLLAQAREVVAEGGSASEMVPLLADYGGKVERIQKELQTTFSYYSRLASIGTIAQKLVHEVGHNVSIIGAFLRLVRDFFVGSNRDVTLLQKHTELAERAVQALGRLAELFRPLASRTFARGKREASVREIWTACLEAKGGELRQLGVRCDTSLRGVDSLRIDPGELWTVLYNLLDNTLYWLGRTKDGTRRILLETRPTGEAGRILCLLHDSGPGVDREDQTRIFLPGVTRRPNGFGMGLTIASEVILGHGGKMGVKSPGKLGGATFRFDLPIASR
ncbi:MAG: sensor histidine kinase [Acidobacteriota bacterium]